MSLRKDGTMFKCDRRAAVKRWIKALRHGGYRQTRGTLKVEDKVSGNPCYAYCCLGVLTQTEGAHKEVAYLQLTPSRVCSSQRNRGVVKASKSSMVPTTLRERFNFKYGFISKCMSMNDVDKKSFSQIADYVEEQGDLIYND